MRANLWFLLGMSVAAAPGVMAQVPGWRVTADSQAQLDTTIRHSGRASGRMVGLAPEDFVNIRQGIKPDSLRGRRVRFTGYVRTDLVEGFAGLWMRVDGAGVMEVLAFDNMASRKIEGVTPWTRYDVVLDVPAGASMIVLGVLMVGQGRVWFDDASLEPVDASVPSTDLVSMFPSSGGHGDEELTPADIQQILASRQRAPLQLRNPDFEQRP